MRRNPSPIHVSHRWETNRKQMLARLHTQVRSVLFSVDQRQLFDGLSAHLVA